MFGSSTGAGTGKKRPATSYLARPRLGALKSFYSLRPFSSYGEKRKKIKKSLPKMEYRRRPDYADNAYREAVSRLRILLAESYTPIKRPLRELDSAGEETDNQSLISAGSRTSRYGKGSYYYLPTYPRRYHYYPTLVRPHYTNVVPQSEKNVGETTSKFETAPPPELMSFIERQEDYIEQLEKESTFCKEELSSLLSKVKDVISENEHLHEKQKSKLIKSVFEHLDTETETETDADLKKISKSPKSKILIEGPSIVYESRISELEAQLTQARIDLKKSQEENDELRKKYSDGGLLEGPGFDIYKKQLDKVQKEKDSLQETVTKLQNALSRLRDKENDTCDQVKRSLDVAEQAQYEKNAAELEIRRLKDELERQHSKLREAIADQSRRISDERSTAERRYTQQIEQLQAELGVQWETTNKLQLELDKQRRENADFRREVAQKQALIDELKKDMQSKIITLQSDIGVSGAEKSALEQQIATLHLANERNERQAKQEITRLQAEIQSLRQRLDRADADLIHSRRENIRLSEQVSSLEKEINLNAALSEERNKSSIKGTEIMALPPPKKDNRENELSSMVHDMENKHAATVAELEGMIQSQNQLMDKLSSECHALTKKLEDASNKHKEEIRELQTNLDRLNNRLSQTQMITSPAKGDGNSENAAPALASYNRTENPPISRKNSQYEVQPSSGQFESNLHKETDKQQYNQYADENYDPNNYDPSQYMTQEQYDEMYQNNQYDPNQYEMDPNQYQQQYEQGQYQDSGQEYANTGQEFQNLDYQEPSQSYEEPKQEQEPTQQNIEIESKEPSNFQNKNEEETTNDQKKINDK